MKSISRYGETIVKLSDYVKQLDENVRAEAFRFLLANECGLVSESPVSVTPAVQREPRSRAMAPQELLRQCSAASFTEKAMVLAYWLEEHLKQASFSSSDLKAAFEQAREQSPKNPSDMVSKLETSARIMKTAKVGTVQHYRLTSTAIQEVQSKLNSKPDNK